MDEILPGVFHWSTPHPAIGTRVSSYLLTDTATAIDPLLPEGRGPEWLGREVRAVVVTICLHTRSVEAFGLPVHAPRPGLHRWEGRDIPVEAYDDGDEVVPGVRALRIGAIAPDDFALRIAAGPGAVAFADGLVNYGGVGFVPDSLMGDDPEDVKRRTVEAVSVLLEEDFDALLFAHGDPIPSGGKAALRAFVEAQRG